MQIYNSFNIKITLIKLWELDIFKLVQFGLLVQHFLYEFFLRVLPNSLHQEIVDSFQATAFSFSLFGGAFYLCYSALQVPVGFIFDKYGIKKSLFFATIACALGALLFL